MQELSWKPFSLTYVAYPVISSSDNDATSLSFIPNLIPRLLALMSLFPIFFICSLTSCTIVYKDVMAAYLLLGALLMALLTSLLKEVIGQPRPPSNHHHIRGGDDDEENEFGMPSNHSSVAFFGATFVILHVMVFRRRHLKQHVRKEGGSYGAGRSSSTASLAIMNGKSSKTSSACQSLVGVALIKWLYHHLHTTIPAVSIFLIASGCAYSRIYLQYHSWNQVIAGSILGTGCGILWYASFRMDIVQEKLAWLDGLIQELEVLGEWGNDNLTCSYNNSDEKQFDNHNYCDNVDDDSERKKK